MLYKWSWVTGPTLGQVKTEKLAVDHTGAPFSSPRQLIICRTLYSGAIIAYMAGVVWPRWLHCSVVNGFDFSPQWTLCQGQNHFLTWVIIFLVKRWQRSRKRPRGSGRGGGGEEKGGDGRKRGPAVDKVFFGQLKALIKIMIPGLWTVEAGLLSLHTLVLVIRTFLSIYVAKLEGRMVRHIVGRDVSSFVWLLTTWFGIALPATFINSLIRSQISKFKNIIKFDLSLRFLECRVALAFQSQLVGEAYRRYLSDQTYYRVSNLDGRLANPDHCLTDDISAFTSACAHLYSHISKPILDATLISLSLFQLARSKQSNTWSGPLIAATVVFSTARLLRLVSPRFGSLVAEEASRKGFLRNIHSRFPVSLSSALFGKFKSMYFY